LNLLKSCNGYSELCSRRFNEVTYATTHNSYSLVPNLAGNQNNRISKQLKDGIRGLMLDLHLTPEDPKTIKLCHTDCKLLDAGTLSTTLQEINSFLYNNPGEVLTIFLENFSMIPVDLIATVFMQNDLHKYALTQAPEMPWPTLRQMIQSNKRLVIFIDNKTDPRFPWIHHEFTYAWESPYSVPSNSHFNCSIDRPKNQPRPIFVLNHFAFTELNIGRGNISIPALNIASHTNGNQLNLHVQQCTKERNQIPNFIAVDFYKVGDVFKATAQLNRVAY
ncbi:PLC-like phosphodiesterase, partial [Basidiobolus meristosporus CBS 931.73]